MSGKDLRELLHAVDDTRELVLRPLTDADEGWRVDELHLAWLAARDEARDAYGAWHLLRSADAYAVYLAAEDRADAAFAALAAESIV
jgi:hypothetical protein